MTSDDPDDAPTRRLTPSRPKSQFIFQDETTAPPAPPLSAPTAPQLDPDHVVTRRISAPGRIASLIAEEAAAQASTAPVGLPSGWLTVVAGPGLGHFMPVYIGMNSVGRESANTVSLNFGDDQISRREHCFVTYDEEAVAFWVQHGGKGNLVRLNDAPVLTPMTLSNGDTIRLGQTKLRFTALCGPDFDWSGKA